MKILWLLALPFAVALGTALFLAFTIMMPYLFPLAAIYFLVVCPTYFLLTRHESNPIHR